MNVAEELGVHGFNVSGSSVQLWKQWKNRRSAAFHGAGGSVNSDETKERMETILGLLNDL